MQVRRKMHPNKNFLQFQVIRYQLSVHHMIESLTEMNFSIGLTF